MLPDLTERLKIHADDHMQSIVTYSMDYTIFQFPGSQPLMIVYYH